MSAIAAIVIASSVQTVSASTIIIDGVGGPVSVTSKNLSATVFATAAIVSGHYQITDSVLKTIHDDVNANVATDGKITVLALDTDHGLALFNLVDDQNILGPGGAANATLGFSTNVDKPSADWVNDAGSDLTSTQVGVNPTVSIVQGDFKWDNTAAGDAFAWANLDSGDSGGVLFSKTNLSTFSNPKPIQFVTWTGTKWMISGTEDFKSGNNASYSFTVAVPLPPAVWAGLSLMGMMGVQGIRRQRLNKASE